jgi:hypothetical protein
VMVKAGSDAAVKALFDECVSEVKKVTPKF